MRINWKSFIRVLREVGPIALVFAGVPPVLIPAIVHGIELAEQSVSPMTGPEKRAFVLDSVATAATAVNAVRPGTLVSGYPETVGKGIDTTVAVVNLIERQRAQGAQEGATTQ
mgnify:CR=1 FL=1